MEEFIRKNREAFDMDMPSTSVWESIDAELRPSGRMVELKWLYRVAAGVAIILTMGVLLGYYIGSQQEPQSIQSQLAGVEHYYQQKMDQKMAVLASYDATDVVRNELHNLESGYAQLTSESPLDEERYMHAVISNFEARLALLEKVLLHLEKYSNQGKIENNEIRDLQI